MIRISKLPFQDSDFEDLIFWGFNIQESGVQDCMFGDYDQHQSWRWNLIRSILWQRFFAAIFKKPLPNSSSWKFTPRFSSKSFILIFLTCRSMIIFELIFEYGMREQLHSFMCRYSVVPVPCAEKAILSSIELSGHPKSPCFLFLRQISCFLLWGVCTNAFLGLGNLSWFPLAGSFSGCRSQFREPTLNWMSQAAPTPNPSLSIHLSNLLNS